MTSDWTTGNDAQSDGPDPSDTEWAWFADAYRKVPQPRQEAVAAALHAVQASVTTWHLLRVVLRWVFGMTAGTGLVIAGYTLVRSYGLVPAASRSAPANEVRPARDREPGVPLPPVNTAPIPAPIPASPAAPTVAPAPPTRPPVAIPPPADVPPAPTAPATGPQPKADSADAAGPDQFDLTPFQAVLSASQLHHLADLGREAARAGIPPVLLLECVRDNGMDKPASLLLKTVERRLAVLQSVHATLGPDATAAELSAGADAVEAGVAAHLVELIWWHAPPGRATAGFAGLAGLVTHGVPAPAAAEAIFDYFGADASDDDLVALRTDVAADIAHGIPPLVALHRRVEHFTGIPAPAVTPAPEP